MPLDLGGIAYKGSGHSSDIKNAQVTGATELPPFATAGHTPRGVGQLFPDQTHGTDIYANLGVVWEVNVGIYSILGWSGVGWSCLTGQKQVEELTLVPNHSGQASVL